jgi:hypothetical protein
MLAFAMVFVFGDFGGPSNVHGLLLAWRGIVFKFVCKQRHRLHGLLLAPLFYYKISPPGIKLNHRAFKFHH